MLKIELRTLLVSGVFTALSIALAAPAFAVDGCSAADFRTAISFNIGANTAFTRVAVVTSDLNGDAKQDTVATDFEGNSVAVFLNDGTGWFAAPTKFAVGINPSTLVLADFNADGHADLVVANSGSNSVSVLLGTGGGSFGPASTFAVGTGPASVTVADFNGDGKVDLAVGNDVGRSVSLLLGNGSGDFSPASGSPLAFTGRVVAVNSADFNSDSKRDLVVGTSGVGQNENGFFVLTGDGGGGFSAPLEVFGGSGLAISTSDLNGDGKPDLVLGLFGGMAVVIGNGAGGFSAPTLFTLEVGGSVDSVAVADLDGDGKQDVAAASISVGVTIFKGDGAGGLSRGTTYVAKTNPASVVVSDFDGDAKQDIAVAGPNGPVTSLSIIANSGAGVFAAPHSAGTTYNTNFPLAPSNVAIGDFNGDGRPDMAVSHFTQAITPAIVAILLNDAAGGFTRMPPISYFPTSTIYRVVAADFNEDGKTDVAVAATISLPFTHVVSISLGNGDGTFAAPVNITFGQSPWDLVVGEFNNDGNLDLVVVSGSSPSYTILLGNGSGGFTVTSAQFPGTRFDRVAVGDFNGDSKQDLVINDFDDNRIVVLTNNGAAQFAVTQSIDLPGTPKAIVVDDFNADGKRDIAVANQTWSAGNPILEEARISVLLGDGAGGFAPTVHYKIGTQPEDLRARDLDGDGNLDLVVSSGISVLSGDGTGAFRSPVGFGSGARAIGVADFDADTRPDLALASGLSVTVMFGKAPISSPCLFADDVIVTEGDSASTEATVTIRLSAASAHVVKVNYLLRGFSAMAGEDFTGGAGTLVFQPGDTSKTVTVSGIGDMNDEPEESFALILSGPLNARISDDLAAVKILDNDLPPLLSISDASVQEGNSIFSPNTAQFTVTLSAFSAFPITVNFATAAGTAISSDDFEPAQGTLNFQPGTTSKTINVSSRGDLLHEPDETFFVNLSNATAATIADGQGQGTILNDDPAPGITVFNAGGFEVTGADSTMTVNIRLSNPSSLQVKADFATADGTAIAGSDYVGATGTVTFNPGETQKVINFTIKDDVIDEVNETFFVDLSNLVNATAVDLRSDCQILDNDGPAISINDISVLEGAIGGRNASFTISLSAASPQSVSVRAITANGTANSSSFPADYQTTNRFVTIPAGSTSATFNVVVIGDLNIEPDETFFVNLSQPQEGTVGDGQGVATITNDDATIQFSAAGISVAENDNRVNLTVTRGGATFTAVTVDYLTSDTAGLTNCNVINGIASSRCDYATSIGTVRFTAGETSKTISIPIVDDAYAEGNESFSITLSNPAGSSLGTPATATVTINDNETSNGTNPADLTPFFVRQHYIDFLNREPDPAGAAGWEAVINNCPPNDTTCDRIHVSSAFFRSAEFQGRGYFVYRFYPVSFGRKPDYVEFTPDLAKVSGFLSDAELEAARVAFIAEFMNRPAFVTKFGGLNDTQYVDTLLSTAGVAPHQFRDFWIAALGNGTRTRATVLREIAESPEVYNKYYNQAFVVMQYFGYLRRDPDALYLDWIQVLDTTEDFRGMVNGFMNSAEYRFRFGP